MVQSTALVPLEGGPTYAGLHELMLDVQTNSVLNAELIIARPRWKPPKLKEEKEEAAHVPSNKVS